MWIKLERWFNKNVNKFDNWLKSVSGYLWDSKRCHSRWGVIVGHSRATSTSRLVRGKYDWGQERSRDRWVDSMTWLLNVLKLKLKQIGIDDIAPTSSRVHTINPRGQVQDLEWRWKPLEVRWGWLESQIVNRESWKIHSLTRLCTGYVRTWALGHFLRTYMCNDSRYALWLWRDSPGCPAVEYWPHVYIYKSIARAYNYYPFTFPFFTIPVSLYI